ncbi:5-methyltetrahydropteroyltriglutamate--homocysteine S-methyltransferase [Lacrimispora indolis]|uniref:5-methyltetrahydropteroyltriglutamate-- homocysteine S-methyltransferase n=1 Tax=Lacrimispora indolis TaxID=69825 RepID=UPI0003F6A83E|nr:MULTISPECIES: 5-methyltetrahydropteroyltriglutamate--homocysteine S-methyltransferase [Lachnospiraceae]
MRTSVVGYPRVGALRELKFSSERYFKEEISSDELQTIAGNLRSTHWNTQQNHGIDFIPSNDFSFYDTVLDTAVLLNVIPARYRSLALPPLDTYFAMARGYQGANGDVKALAMKKWFNTNYHYMVPEIDDNTEIRLAGSKPFDEFEEALQLGIQTKPVLIGAFTFLKLARFTGEKHTNDFTEAIIRAYQEILTRFHEQGAKWLQFDEPSLVHDLTHEDILLFKQLYSAILSEKGTVNVLLQTYFGDIRDCYEEITGLAFDGIGMDFVEGKESLELIKTKGFPSGKVLFAGIVNGKNIWKNNYRKSFRLISELHKHCSHIVLGTSCSLLHVPYTLLNETKLPEKQKCYFSFAMEKLNELKELKEICLSQSPLETEEYKKNAGLLKGDRNCSNEKVQQRVRKISESDLTRLPEFAVREELQQKSFGLPCFPTTTIGSFPQTAEVKANRTAFRKGSITEAQYCDFIKEKIFECVKVQEEMGLDVLVHGEFERNDMVEYFGECLNGYLFTEKGWVQSYGTRCVKPPVIWGDISRERPMTVEWSVYAQRLTHKPMKGMLTGPVTILNWSFPREDISLKETAFQIALAIGDEVLDLESNGIRIIQIDEAALREKLPLRKSDWDREYLSWAIPAFRLVHSRVKPETQIHTHMCYSEFTDIIPAIDNMDADVITFEASRSDLMILDSLKENHFKTEVGPGVYDIHSPRVPSVEEIESALHEMLKRLPKEKLWVNPDCGLKTRQYTETKLSLEHMVQAARRLRNEAV